jgi:hypothetical protein
MVASDPVAAAVEEHLRGMQAEGYGEFAISQDEDEVVLSFAAIGARGESYNLALLRLAGAVLDSDDLCTPFLVRMRKPSPNPLAAILRDKDPMPRKAAMRR